MFGYFLNSFNQLVLKHKVTRKACRFLLNLVPRNLVFPILTGSARGKKWIVRSSPYDMGMGIYEMEVQSVFNKLLSKGMIFYDIGSHVGFFAIIGSELVGPEGKVVAFEPMPQHQLFLKEHVRLNNCNNVIIMDAAVSLGSGEETMCFRGYDMWGSFLSAGFSPNGDVRVRTVSLDDLASSSAVPPPDFIKMDIEGAEFLALQGGKRTIAEFRPVIILSTHGPEVKEQCCNFLQSLGYECSPLGKGKIIREDELLCTYKGAAVQLYGT